jgi:hypothetical protein
MLAPYQVAVRLKVYVTDNVSPDATERSPGEVKSEAENSTPVVPLLVLLLIKKAPPTVAVALIVKDAGEALFVATDGLAVVGVPNVQAGRVALLYGTISVKPGCVAAVSLAVGLLDAAAPYRPRYQVAEYEDPVKYLAFIS